MDDLLNFLAGKAFDVLGEFDGENELEYNKYVNGKFITDDHPKQWTKHVGLIAERRP